MADYKVLLKRIDRLCKPIFELGGSDGVRSKDIKAKYNKEPMAELAFDLFTCLNDARKALEQAVKLSQEQSVTIQKLDDSLVEAVEDKSKHDLINTLLEGIRENRQSIDEMRTELSKSTEVVRAELKEEIEALPDKFRTLQSEKKPGSDNGDEATYASVVGDTNALVYPIKRAMIQLKEDDLRARNVVIHGLDIDPNAAHTLMERRHAIKMQANDILTESTIGTPYKVSADTESIIILGKVADSGKAPPVLVKLKNEKEAKHVLRYAMKLAKVPAFRKVFVSADLGVDEVEKRRNLVQRLKDKIRDFPGEHWIIREGTVTSNGTHVPSQLLTVEKDLKSYQY